jgi:hypothetical protein
VMEGGWEEHVPSWLHAVVLLCDRLRPSLPSNTCPQSMHNLPS